MILTTPNPINIAYNKYQRRQKYRKDQKSNKGCLTFQRGEKSRFQKFSSLYCRPQGDYKIQPRSEYTILKHFVRGCMKSNGNMLSIFRHKQGPPLQRCQVAQLQSCSRKVEANRAKVGVTNGLSPHKTPFDACCFVAFYIVKVLLMLLQPSGWPFQPFMHAFVMLPYANGPILLGNILYAY